MAIKLAIDDAGLLPSPCTDFRNVGRPDCSAKFRQYSTLVLHSTFICCFSSQQKLLQPTLHPQIRADAYAQLASSLRKPTVYLLIIPVGEFAVTPYSDSWVAAQNLGTFYFYNLSSTHFVLVM